MIDGSRVTRYRPRGNLIYSKTAAPYELVLALLVLALLYAQVLLFVLPADLGDYMFNSQSGTAWRSFFVFVLAINALSLSGVAHAQASRLALQPPIKLFEETGDSPSFVGTFDVNADASLDLVVTHGGSSNLNVFLNDGSGGFTLAPGAPFAVGPGPNSATGGDFNEDGHLDLATANGSSDDVTILIGDGNGGFTALPAPIAAGSFPVYIASADLNSDGHLDLVVVNGSSDDATILLGDGQSGFASAPASPVAVGNFPWGVEIGLIDGDANLDLAVTNSSDDNVQILLGDGAGGFDNSTLPPIPLGDRPRDLVLADLNLDETLDLAVVNEDFSQGSVSVLLNDGSAGFTEVAGSPIPAGRPRDITVTDVDGDGSLDLVTVSPQGDAVDVLLNNGSGQFAPSPQTPITVFNHPSSVASGDFDGDGASDFVIAHALGDQLSIFDNDGSGSFIETPESPIVLGVGPYDAVVDDFDGDGRNDVAIAQFRQGNILILQGDGNAGFKSRGVTPDIGSTPRSIVSSDFDSDGNPDLATVDSGSNRVAVLLGDGNGGFSPAPGEPFPAGSITIDLAAGDADSDGNPDLFVAGFFSDDLSILMGTGTGEFIAGPGSPIALGGRTTAVETGLFDGDSDLDLVVANSELDVIHVLLGDGNGGFVEAAGSPVSVGQDPRSLAVDDLDADGELDIVVGNNDSADISVLLGDGLGGFTNAAGSPVSGASAAAANAVAIIDVNNDDILDLLAADNATQSIGVLIGDGSGGFSPASNSPIAVVAPAISINLGDVDGDGRLDALSLTDGGATPDEFLILLTSNVLFSTDFSAPSVAE